MSTDAHLSPPDLFALRTQSVTVLDEPTGKQFLRTVGIEVPSGVVAQSAQDAALAAEQVGFPCMVKLAAYDLAHKSDIGGVAGPLDNRADVEQVAARMLAAAPPSTRGILVEPWVRGTAEVFMGLSMDTSYGPVVMFGAGGVWVEEFQDVAYRLAPVDAPEALAMIRSRRATRFLDGKHGTGAVALDQLASVVQRFSRLALDPRVRSHVREIEVNPLILRSSGDPIAVDCTVVLRDTGDVVDVDDPQRPQRKELTTMSKLNSFLEPRSVAVVGASRDRRKPGNLILRNILDGGYKGTIYPVNPGGGEIEGLTAYKSVSEVPTAIDLVIIVLGRQHVENALIESIAAGASSVCIVTAGFGEGDEMGKAAQVRFKQLVAESGIVAIGPNTIGYINKEVDLFASFVNFPAWDDGPVALIAMTGIYSGAVVHELMSDPSQRIGIRLSIDIGNRIGLSELELLEELSTRPDIEVLGFYIEEFENARRFLARAAEVKREKPIVMLKPGRTPEGAQAALSHTGSLASDDAIVDQLLQQHGIIRAEDNEEFVGLLRTFAYCPTPAGRRVGIITYSGALGITATDAVVHAGLEVAELSAETSERLNELAPDWQTVRNPADLWSAAESDPGKAARQLWPAMLADESVDQLLFVLLALPNVDFEGMREVFAQMREQRPEIPIHVTFSGGLRGEWTRRLEGLGVVVHRSARSAARAMAALATYSESRDLAPSTHGIDGGHYMALDSE